MSEKPLAYIAGFLDGDGCIMAQLVKRPGYVYGYQIRTSIVFYQKTAKRQFLEWLHSKFRLGYVRDRNDGMTEYTIVGHKAVLQVLQSLIPYLRLKRVLARRVSRICKLSLKQKPTTINQFLRMTMMVDQTAKYNYSKKRTTTTDTVKSFLAKNKLIPCND